MHSTHAKQRNLCNCVLGSKLWRPEQRIKPFLSLAHRYCKWLQEEHKSWIIKVDRLWLKLRLNWKLTLHQAYRKTEITKFKTLFFVPDHHAQSAKKELKDLSVQPAEASTTSTTTTTTTLKLTTSNDAFMNRNKTSNINNVLTTTTTTSTEKSRSKPDVTVDEQDYITSKATDQSTIGTSLVVGLVWWE